MIAVRDRVVDECNRASFVRVKDLPSLLSSPAGLHLSIYRKHVISGKWIHGGTIIPVIGKYQ